MRISTLVAVAALTSMVAGAALAQPPGGRGMMPDLATMDTNKDGKVSKDEFKAALASTPAADRAEMMFDRRDGNKDGFLSAEELSAPMGRGPGGGGAPGGGPAPKQ